MAESSYTKIENINGVTLAAITLEKVSDREAPIVQNEVVNGSLGTKHRIALDLSAVHMLTSAGIGMLVTLHKTAKGAGGAFCAFGIRPDIMQVLKLTNLHKLVVIAETRDAAMKKVAP